MVTKGANNLSLNREEKACAITVTDQILKENKIDIH